MSSVASADSLDLEDISHSPVPVRRFKDSVHDYISFAPEVCAIIDTPEFQRLRHVKQLGTSFYVWPCASHNRFEHCLGVAHLAHRMVTHLRDSQPDLDIDHRDVLCVTIAGLCHDLGHGPWSHVWDSLFIPTVLPLFQYKSGKTWSHEDASEMMFDALLQSKDNGITFIDAGMASFIKALIAGEPSMCTTAQEKPFLFEIVANKRNGLDVDKFDYISRDTLAVDQKTLSLTRLIHSARVIGGQICYDIKDANQIYELCYTRFSLHKRIYNHKAAKAIEYMLIDGLLAAEPILHVAERIKSPDTYLHLTDNIKEMIESDPRPELDESRQIFARIARRKLYRVVDYKVFPWDYKQLCHTYITPDTITAAAKCLKDANPADVAALQSHHIIVDLSPMHYGMQNENPLHYVRFYSKHRPNIAEKAGPGDISLLMPSQFAEILLRVYTRDNHFFGLIQAGYRAVLESLPLLEPETEPDTLPALPLLPSPTRVHTPPPPTLSPPITEAPSTPPPRVRPPTSRGLKGTPLPNNSFTSVPTTYRVPPSPSMVTRGAKRGRDISGGSEAGPAKKRKAT